MLLGAHACVIIIPSGHTTDKMPYPFLSNAPVHSKQWGALEFLVHLDIILALSWSKKVSHLSKEAEVSKEIGCWFQTPGYPIVRPACFNFVFNIVSKQLDQRISTSQSYSFICHLEVPQGGHQEWDTHSQFRCYFISHSRWWWVMSWICHCFKMTQ